MQIHPNNDQQDTVHGAPEQLGADAEGKLPTVNNDGAAETQFSHTSSDTHHGASSEELWDEEKTRLESALGAQKSRAVTAELAKIGVETKLVVANSKLNVASVQLKASRNSNLILVSVMGKLRNENEELKEQNILLTEQTKARHSEILGLQQALVEANERSGTIMESNTRLYDKFLRLEAERDEKNAKVEELSRELEEANADRDRFRGASEQLQHIAAPVPNQPNHDE